MRCPALLLALASLTGCQGFLMSSTGDMMNAYTIKHLAPYTLGSTDPGMACEIAQSTGNLLLSYRRVSDPPNKSGITTLASAGACAEAEAMEHELRGIRAIKRGDAGGAQDARIAQQRAHAVAASRFYRAYQSMVRTFGEFDGTCPEFDRDEVSSDEIAWLIGHLAGAQAVQHDRAAKAAVNVPTDIPRRVARGMECLKNDRWWGVPHALQAAVWVGVPGATPEGKDPWKQLDDASAVGRASGVRLALAIHAQAAATVGEVARVRAQIKAIRASQDEKPPPKQWRMLDIQARINATVLSDRMWTQATGHRTPWGGLGTFWDEAEKEELDGDLFEGLEDEPPAPVEKAPKPVADPKKAN